MHFFNVLVVPKNHHIITVDRQKSFAGGVALYREYIRIFRLLILVYLDLFLTCLNIGLAQWWRLGDCHDVIQTLQIEDSNRAIGATTHYVIHSRVNRQTKRSFDLNVHPLFQLFIICVEQI